MAQRPAQGFFWKKPSQSQNCPFTDLEYIEGRGLKGKFSWVLRINSCEEEAMGDKW
jgi:hypothetical protein